MTVRGRPRQGNTGPGSGQGSGPDPDPLLSQRAVLVLIAALVIGIAIGTLAYLAGHHIAAAVLAGLTASGAAVLGLNKLIA